MSFQFCLGYEIEERDGTLAVSVRPRNHPFLRFMALHGPIAVAVSGAALVVFEGAAAMIVAVLACLLILAEYLKLVRKRQTVKIGPKRVVGTVESGVFRRRSHEWEVPRTTIKMVRYSAGLLSNLQPTIVFHCVKPAEQAKYVAFALPTPPAEREKAAKEMAEKLGVSCRQI